MDIVICSESMSCKSLYAPHVCTASVTVIDHCIVSWHILGSKPGDNIMGYSTLSYVCLSEFVVLMIGFRDCYIVGEHITTELHPSPFKILFAQTVI